MASERTFTLDEALALIKEITKGLTRDEKNQFRLEAFKDFGLKPPQF